MNLTSVGSHLSLFCVFILKSWKDILDKVAATSYFCDFWCSKIFTTIEIVVEQKGKNDVYKRWGMPSTTKQKVGRLPWRTSWLKSWANSILIQMIQQPKKENFERADCKFSNFQIAFDIKKSFFFAPLVEYFTKRLRSKAHIIRAYYGELCVKSDCQYQQNSCLRKSNRGNRLIKVLTHC